MLPLLFNPGIVFYPRPQKEFYGHIEATNNGIQYNTFGGFDSGFLTSSKKPLNDVLNRGLSSYRAAHIRWPLLFNAQQKKSVNQYVKQVLGKASFMTCSTGANNMISSSGVLSIPLPYSWSPALTAYWLNKEHQKGNPFIGAPIFVGDTKLSDINTAVKSEIRGWCLVGTLAFLSAYYLATTLPGLF